MRSAKVQLIRAFEGHGVERYEKFGRGCQIFPRHNVLVTVPLVAAISLDSKNKSRRVVMKPKRKREPILAPHWDDMDLPMTDGNPVDERIIPNYCALFYAKTARFSLVNIPGLNSPRLVLYQLIVGCEVAFWLVLLLGLVARYLLHREALSRWLLLSLPAIDVLLMVFTALDLRAGTTATTAHGLAAVYVGFTIAFGSISVRWVDTHFAYRFASGLRRPKHLRDGRQFGSTLSFGCAVSQHGSLRSR